jgi:glycosyltransferase involved in cell wall biosynthesis
MNPISSVPTVGVVLPVYNGAAYLRDALGSIAAQSAGATEIVVVDDGSTDGSAELAAAQPGVRVVRQANAGPGAAINRGVAELTTEFVAFLDADDLWTTDRLARQLACFGGENPPDLVLGHAQNFHSPDLSPEQRAKIHCPPNPQAGYVMGTLLLRRATFDRIGPMRTDWRIGSHIEWFARASDLGLRLLLLPEVVLQRRLHADNLSRREMSARPDFARILKFVLDRRREQKLTPELL